MMLPDDKDIRAKIHIYGGKMIVAICDADIVGRTLDNKGVPFVVNESFYGGPLVRKDELLELLSAGGNINILGKRSIQVAIESDLIDADQIMVIDGIPHVQIFSIRN